MLYLFIYKRRLQIKPGHFPFFVISFAYFSWFCIKLVKVLPGLSLLDQNLKSYPSSVCLGVDPKEHYLIKELKLYIFTVGTDKATLRQAGPLLYVVWQHTVLCWVWQPVKHVWTHY